MKKKILPLLLLLAAAVLLAACGGAEPSVQPEGVTLTLMGRKSDMEKSYMTRIFQRYQEATGNTLEILTFEDADFEARAQEQFSDGKVPDVFMHFHNADLSRFDPPNHFLYLNEEEWASRLTPSARAYCQDRDGRLLGLPFWESSVSGCYYNKTLLDSLGLEPATTQEEFDALCQALADAGHTPVCWPASGCTWMFQFGLDPIFADDPALLEQLNANDVTYAEIPQVVDMVQWIANAAENGWFGSDFMKTGWSEIGPALSSGEAAMTFIWDTWFYTDFESSGPYTVEDFAVMPVFMNTVEGGTYEGGNLNMMMVNKNGDRLEEALAFLDFCAQPENINAAFDGIATVSCFQGQTTNIQSQMVENAKASISANERVSTAASKIIGYSADDVSVAFQGLLTGKTDVDGCIQLMDSLRMAGARDNGTSGF